MLKKEGIFTYYSMYIHTADSITYMPCKIGRSVFFTRGFTPSV